MRASIFISFFALIGFSCVASQDNYVAEVLLVIDPSVYTKYMTFGYDQAKAKEEIRGDTEFFLNQVNSYYESLQANGLYMEIRQSELLLLDAKMYEDCKLTDAGTTLNADLGLRVFKNWISNNQNLITQPYDIALVFTGYDIYGSSLSTAGYATVGAACNSNDNQNIGIVEFSGTEDTAMTMAHELAHSLGSDHDSATCPANGGYIMSPSLDYANANKWSFSACTEAGIATYIDKLITDGTNCLTQTTATALDFQLSSQADRDILSQDKICQRKLGRQDVSVCRTKNLYSNIGGLPDGYCQSLFCAPNGQSTCSSATASEGMQCDVNKRCSKNQCVAAPADFPTKDLGTNGCAYPDDSSGNVYGYPTCEAVLEAYGVHNCQYDDIKSRCCETCAPHYTGIEGCPYGDRSANCASYQPNQICYSEKNIQICCELCNGHSVRRKRSAGGNDVTIEEDKPMKSDLPQQRIKDDTAEDSPRTDQ